MNTSIVGKQTSEMLVILGDILSDQVRQE